ncbi:MAG: hypothetical protein Q9214_000976 [Letrouitia sp. 1 TL-2023]
MASTSNEKTIYGPDLSLTPDQQSLLRTALSSNNPATYTSQSPAGGSASPTTSNMNGIRESNGLSPTSDSLYQSPAQNNTEGGVEGSGGFGIEDSPFLDYDLEVGTFDWENSGDKLFGDLPGGTHEDEDLHDKRKNGAGEEDEQGNNKRHEGNDKSNKKPGRKPLNSSEPTTKRKAQNRAAQRAFRERKERHLKDLEAKVEDLEKASEATNHENGRLRATVDRLNNELKEYRKRLSLTSTQAGYSPPVAPMPNNNYSNNDFQFAFPRFGDLPGSSFMSNGSIAKISPTKAPSRPSTVNTANTGRAQSISSNSKSPTDTGNSPQYQNGTSSIGSTPYSGFQGSPTGYSGNAIDGLFSPSILESASRSNSQDYMFPTINASTLSIPKQNSIDTSSPFGQHRASSASMTASPSVSSVSHNDLNSSCGTTPEPSADSPGHPGHRKPSEGVLKTINEESAPKNSIDGKKSFCDEWATACGNSTNPVPRSMSQSNTGPALPSSVMKSPDADVNSIDWMAQQNGGQFDPVLFGDYRDSQDSLFNNEFFNDAFTTQDFSTPYNIPEGINPSAPKKDLMQQVEEQQNAEMAEVVPGEQTKQYLTCDKLWDRVQASEIAQSGEFDLDSLCSQLKAKAKCSGTGAVIEQKDVDTILGPPPEEQKDFLKMFK